MPKGWETGSKKTQVTQPERVMPTIKLRGLFITMVITLKTDTQANSQIPSANQEVIWECIHVYNLHSVLGQTNNSPRDEA